MASARWRVSLEVFFCQRMGREREREKKKGSAIVVCTTTTSVKRQSFASANRCCLIFVRRYLSRNKQKLDFGQIRKEGGQFLPTLLWHLQVEDRHVPALLSFLPTGFRLMKKEPFSNLAQLKRGRKCSSIAIEILLSARGGGGGNLISL